MDPSLVISRHRTSQVHSLNKKLTKQRHLLHHQNRRSKMAQFFRTVIIDKK